VLNAEYVWTSGAEVLLRIEDHDRERCRPEFEAGILEDLEWLGYRADAPLVRQSERGGIYHDALHTLVTREMVYGCACSRRELDARPCPCRERRLTLTDGIGWRLRMDPGVESFVDQRLGLQQQDPSAGGDVLVRDRLGNWTYQFVATVDDFRQGIDLIIRGEDLLPSTGRQIRIARLLGRQEPATFLHHPLIMKSATHKLSKSDNDTGIRELRARGWTPEQVRATARSHR
jgi:glutamyl/glutaminyl-tRNA synthetase